MLFSVKKLHLKMLLNPLTIVFVAVTAFLAFVSCELGAENKEEVRVNVENFRISNELPGWTEISYDLYDLDGLMLRHINGGAEFYRPFGLAEGIRQEMKNGDKTYDVFIMDFVYADSAESMFEAQKESQNKLFFPVGAFDTTTALAVKNPLGGSIFGFARLQEFYFEVTLMGIRDQDITHH